MTEYFIPFIAAPILAYLIGAISFAYIAGKLFYQVDVRDYGSGNLGATNVVRVLGFRVGIPVLILDMMKGFLPVFFVAPFISEISGYPEGIIKVIIALSAIVGHMFPVYMKFKGGKGVATSAGALLAMTPVSAGIAITVFVIIVFLTRYVSLGSILGAVTISVCAVILEQKAFGENLPVTIFCFIMSILVIFRHRSNIKRLLQGKENKLSFKSKMKD